MSKEVQPLVAIELPQPKAQTESATLGFVGVPSHYRSFFQKYYGRGDSGQKTKLLTDALDLYFKMAGKRITPGGDCLDLNQTELSI